MENSSWVGSQKIMPGVLHGVARFLAVLGLRVSVVRLRTWMLRVAVWCVV